MIMLCSHSAGTLRPMRVEERGSDLMTKAAKTSPEDQPAQAVDEDFAIYPHRDHITVAAIPFNLNDYGDRGAFSEEQIQTLSGRHSLSMEQIRELSRLVGYALDNDSQVSLVTISRATAARRMSDRKLGKRARDRQLDAAEANALFDGFGFDVRVAEEINISRTNSGDSIRLKMHGKDVSFVSLNEAQRILQPDDRTKERDSRRILVVESCCYVALDAGWPVTYTSDSKVEKNQRGGRLINLIKDVIAMVSDNARIASVHTLKDDIERIWRRFAMRGDLPARHRQKQRSQQN